MRATYRIAEDDYVNAMKLYNKFSRKQIIAFSTAALALVGCAVFGNPIIAGAAIGGLIGGIIVGVVGRYIVSPFLARRHYRKYKAIHEEFTVDLRDEGIYMSSSNGEGKITWDKILKWRQNDRYVPIYPMPRLYYILPKSIESGGIDLARLTGLLKQHVGDFV